MKNPEGTRMNKEARRAAILRAAMEIFREKGYEGTSLNAIIERVGGSKRNFYTEFGGKDGLFRALIDEKTREQAVRLSAKSRSGDLREGLLELARLIVSNFADDEFLALYRFAVVEGLRFPEIVRAVFEVSHLSLEQYVAELLDQAEAQGAIHVPDRSAAAGHFASLLHGRLFYELLFSLRSELSREETETFAASAVDLFLNGIRKPCLVV